MLMQALIYSDQRRALWVMALKYGLFFAGAVVNLTLCYWATHTKRARPFLTPLFFSAPILLATAPTVPFMWYGGSAIGGLIGSGHQRIAAWISLGVFALLFANAMFRIYLAATAASHVTIGVGLIVSKLIDESLISGASYGLLMGLIPPIVLGVAYAVIMFWRPDLPICRCGQTKYGEYEYIGPMKGFSEDTWYENRCPKCERHYKSKGKVLIECKANGTLIPYMRVSKWGRWQLNNAEPDAAVVADRPHH